MFKRILCLPLLVIFFGIGTLLIRSGFNRVQSLREIERIPRTTISALIPGEANVSGEAQIHEETLRGPDSNEICLYYRYTVEERKEDSEGRRRWRTIKRRTDWVPFQLQDETGSILVHPEGAGTVTLKTMHSRRRGDRRYTERRIDPGMEIFAMGRASPRDQQMLLRFTGPGAYQPILSTATEEEERGSVGLFSLLITVAGLGFLSLAMFAFTRLVGLHQTLVYLSLVALTIVVTMLIQSNRMIRSDLNSAFDRLEREREVRTDAVRELLSGTDVSWDGDWQGLGERLVAHADRMDERIRERIVLHRVNLARSIRRAERIREGFPERLVAASMGIGRPEGFDLSADEIRQMEAVEAQFVHSRISGRAAALMGLLGLAAATVLGGGGIRLVKTKRWIENIPTTSTTGAVYGMNEFKGEVALPDGAEPLCGPLSNEPCAWYHYLVKKKRGSGKKAKWVTVTDEKKQIPFLCCDSEGKIPVDPEGAEIITSTRLNKREGKKRYIERRLPVGSPLYALGSAVIDEQTHDRLRLARGEDQRMPFILSDYSDTELVSKKAGSGFLSLNLGFTAFMLAGFSLAGYRGGFGAVSYMTAALIPVLYLLFFMGCVLYNDLVYLRRRCHTMWANIDVALKKRFDLLPQLVSIAGRYLEHERELQEMVTDLRTGGRAMPPEEAGEMVEEEIHTLQRLLAVVEDYPDLKGDEVMADLMHRTRDLEDDVALMRQGYNQTVEVYNTRIARIPEVLLARSFRFKPRTFFSTDDQANFKVSL